MLSASEVGGNGSWWESGAARACAAPASRDPCAPPRPSPRPPPRPDAVPPTAETEALPRPAVTKRENVEGSRQQGCRHVHEEPTLQKFRIATLTTSHISHPKRAQISGAGAASHLRAPLAPQRSEGRRRGAWEGDGWRWPPPAGPIPRAPPRMPPRTATPAAAWVGVASRSCAAGDSQTLWTDLDDEL